MVLQLGDFAHGGGYPTRSPSRSHLEGKAGILGKPPIFISIEAMAELIQDKALFEKHWNADLERWFQQGPETPGIVLIKAHAERIKYWDGEEEGEVKD